MCQTPSCYPPEKLSESENVFLETCFKLKVMLQELHTESSYGTCILLETCKIALRIKMAQIGTKLQTETEAY